MSYTKLDAGLTESTIWYAPDTTRIVWITMLAMADQNGFIGASVPGLAGRARVSMEACIEALEVFKAPDQWSRTKEHEGRRIADAAGGWILLNHAQYRAKQNAEDRRERSRVAMAALRGKRQQPLTVNTCEPVLPKRVNTLRKLTQAEAEAEAEKRMNSSGPAVLQNSPDSSLTGPPPAPPPAHFNGLNADEFNGKAVVKLAGDWELPTDWGNDAVALGFTAKETLYQAERFRQFFVTKGNRRSVKGWRQSWGNWLGKEAERHQR